VPDWKRQSVHCEPPVEVATDNCGFDRSSLCTSVDRNSIEVAQVDQQAIVAQRQSNPTMSSATNGDFDPILTSKPDSLDDVCFVFGAQDNSRAPVGYELILDQGTPKVFVATIGRSCELAFDSASEHRQVHKVAS